MSNNYRNPIEKAPMISIPRWEYARLIAKARTLDLLLMLRKEKNYSADALMDTLIKESEDVWKEDV